MPGGTLMKLYRPASLVTAVRAVLVCTSLSLTSAPTIRPLCWSVTCPDTVPAVVDCAKAWNAAKPRRITTVTRYIIALPLSGCWISDQADVAFGSADEIFLGSDQLSQFRDQCQWG